MELKSSYNFVVNLNYCLQASYCVGGTLTYVAIVLSVMFFLILAMPQPILAQSQTLEKIYPSGRGILKFEKPDVSPCYFTIPNAVVKTIDPRKEDPLLNIDDKYAYFFIVLGNQNDDSYQYLQIELPKDGAVPEYLHDLRTGDEHLLEGLATGYDQMAIVLVADKQVNRISDYNHKKYFGGESLNISPNTYSIGPGDYDFGAILFMSNDHAWPKQDRCAVFLIWPFSVNKDGTVTTHTPITDVGQISDITHMFSPLQQHKKGVNPDSIKCKPGHIVASITSEDGNTHIACVTPKTKEKLIERGWTKPV